MSKTHICPACHTHQGAGDGYCQNCGTELESVRYCNSCGVEAAPRSKFCRECGEPLPSRPSIGKREPAAATSGGGSRQPAQSLNSPQPVWQNQPLPTAAPAPNISPPAIPQAAPLAAAPPAAPRGAPASPAPLASTNEINGTQLVIASVMGLVATAALLNGGYIFAIILFIIMLNVGGASLLHVTANGLNKVIDWMWQDPMMRRRILGE